jgi:hypothetical protein
MKLRRPGLLPELTLGMTLALGMTLGLATQSFAQTAPLTLPPPGASGSEATAPKALKKPAPKKKATDESGLAIPGTARSGKQAAPTISDSAIARPKKFVPAEFDNDDSGSSPRPIMTPSGRAGLGMRF